MPHSSFSAFLLFISYILLKNCYCYISDEDFKPEDSASDVAEEYDSNPSTSSDSEEEVGKVQTVLIT
ncbi:hypothetical protein DPMN_015197 [Dreissena polymorpha]|uniref:Uncharacterized protein n=1 Tax=Dreissena polymorpha TaxID=45954 RepID=A0A9D4N7C0_DREPO|nr:hypothetical protein DPMN_015197 [Dreissena polymorpha]